MSIWDSDYYYIKEIKQDAPAWFRLERYAYCEQTNENNASAKRGLFSRLAGKKRSK